jgi:hypothetical protein
MLGAAYVPAMAWPCARPWRCDAARPRPARSGARVPSSCTSPARPPGVLCSPPPAVGPGAVRPDGAAQPWRPELDRGARCGPPAFCAAPHPRSAPARAFFARRAARARDPPPRLAVLPRRDPPPRLAVLPRRDPRPGILHRPTLTAGAWPWPRRGVGAVRSPALAACVRPWPRRGFGAVRSPAQLGGLLAWLTRGNARRGLLAWLARDVVAWRAPLASQLAYGSPRGLLVAACVARGSPSATCSQQQLARVRSSGPRPRSLARVDCSLVQRLNVTLNHLPFVCELSRDDALRHLKVLVPIELYPEAAITRHRLIMLR